jgi:membrane fusion protein, multidrug efflux system
MKRWSIAIGSMVLVLAVIYGGYAWQLKKKIAQFSHMMPAPTAVSITAARTIHWQPVVRSSGQLEASQGVTVKSQGQGQVMAVHMSAGQWVTNNQLLVTLEHADLSAQLASAKAQLKQSQAQYASYKALAAQQNVSRQLLQQQQATLASAQAAVISATTALQHKMIRAPFACHLGLSRVHAGQLIAQGQAIVDCQDTRALKLYFSVSQQYLPMLRLKQVLNVTVDAYPRQSFVGVLRAIDTKISESTRGLALEAVVNNPKQQLLPGMLVSVAMPLGQKKQVVVVPQTAIHTSMYGDSVFVLDKTKPKTLKVKEVRIKAGDAVKDDVIVLHGITAGQQVVSLGQASLRDGSPVTVVAAPQYNTNGSTP